jgi:leucine dehydrogenase
MSVFEAIDYDDHEEVVFVNEPSAGLRAIIAVHNTRRGPAIGGCRAWAYGNSSAALTDVLRLSRGMSYKAAAAGVPFGGGKAVVLLDAGRSKTAEAMLALGRAIELLGGRYVTGEDVGTTAADMALIREKTQHVMGMPVDGGGSGDPSPSTALGCYVGIVAAVRHRLQRDSVSGLRVAVQGLGNVGWNLCRLLHEAGAKLVVADVRNELATKAEREFGAQALAPEVIHSADVEVLAPCALGATLNDQTIPALRASVVAGGANNQLQRAEHDGMLRRRCILYAPDFVINAGGMVQLAMERLGRLEEVPSRVQAIGDTLASIFVQAEGNGRPTGQEAEGFARQRIAESRSG